MNISLKETVGGGYTEFWRSKKRYIVVKGSRGSKKSKTSALWLIVHLMDPRYPLSNALVIRKTERTLRDSCFSDLIWAINKLGVSQMWKTTTSPMELTNTNTGQKILFRGLDDPYKITSISVPVGFINYLWFEEAYEINKESDFDTIDESIRGQMPEGYYKRIMITFNPWNEKHWLKSRFFDRSDPEVLSMTTTYQCNEWLDDKDRNLLESLKERNPRRYRVSALGEWGIVDGLVYERWKEQVFTLSEIKDYETVCGLDFGYTNDPTAFVIGFLDKVNKRFYVYDEFYQKGMSNRAIYNVIERLNYTKEKIIADSAEPKSIDELKGLGLRISSARKGKDSIMNGIQWIQDFEIIIHPRCVNFLTEISAYSWKEDKFGKKLNEPEDDNNHLMDAMRYALENHIREKKWLI